MVIVWFGNKSALHYETWLEKIMGMFGLLVKCGTECKRKKFVYKAFIHKNDIKHRTIDAIQQRSQGHETQTRLYPGRLFTNTKHVNLNEMRSNMAAGNECCEKTLIFSD